MKTIKNKKIKILAIALFATASIYAAAPVGGYLPGATTDPDCVPGVDTDCTVKMAGMFTEGVNSGDAVYTNGNVGVGTNDPESTLDVSGDIKISGNRYLNNGNYDWSSETTEDENGNQVPAYTGTPKSFPDVEFKTSDIFPLTSPLYSRTGRGSYRFNDNRSIITEKHVASATEEDKVYYNNVDGLRVQGTTSNIKTLVGNNKSVKIYDDVSSDIASMLGSQSVVSNYGTGNLGSSYGSASYSRTYGKGSTSYSRGSYNISQTNVESTGDVTSMYGSDNYALHQGSGNINKMIGTYGRAVSDTNSKPAKSQIGGYFSTTNKSVNSDPIKDIKGSYSLSLNSGTSDINNQYGAYNYAYTGNNDKVGSSKNMYGTYSLANLKTSKVGTNTDRLEGGAFLSYNIGASDVKYMRGLYTSVSNTGNGLVNKQSGLTIVNSSKSTNEGDADSLNGEVISVYNNGSTNYGKTTGLEVNNYAYTKSVGNIKYMYGVKIGVSKSSTSTSTIDNAYGLYLGNVTAGKDNYAIYTNLGKSYFRDKVGIGTKEPISKLAVSGLPKGTTSGVVSGDTSGLAGAVCITNDGNMYIDTDGSCAD